MKRTASAPGKIILSGEYAVVFGYPGLAVPARLTMTVTFEEESKDGVEVIWNGEHGREEWDTYLKRIIELSNTNTTGTLIIENQIPLGKGMGSSTALVIAVARALLGDDCKEAALRIEDIVNSGHSGLDFAVIWNNEPTVYEQASGPRPADVDIELRGAFLIDTGQPSETTAELVAWMKERESDVKEALEAIGKCTERLLAGEDICTVIRDHHRAQILLGIVPEKAKSLITKIEQQGGAAKIIGAGGRTESGGMVLALGGDRDTMEDPVIML